MVNELILGALFVITYLFIAPTTLFPLIWVYAFICTGYLIASYDFIHKQIPDLYSFSFVIIGFIVGLNGTNFNDQLLGALIISTFFMAQYLLSKGRWLGSGDIIIGLGMGFALGVKGVIIALILSYFSGSVLGIYLLIRRKVSRKESIPFAPFLMLGTLIGLFWGSQIFNWYIDTTFIF